MHQANDRRCAELGWVSIPIVWLRCMGAGVQRPSGLLQACLPFNHAARLSKVNSD